MARSRRSFLKDSVEPPRSAPVQPCSPHLPCRANRLYAGGFRPSALAEHVIKPAVDAFNKAANGEMEIELYSADQLAPTSELFAALQNGTIDAVQSDDDSIGRSNRCLGVRGVLPARLALQLGCAGSVQPVWAGRNLGCRLVGSGRQVALHRRLGSLPFRDQRTRSVSRRDLPQLQPDYERGRQTLSALAQT